MVKMYVFLSYGTYVHFWQDTQIAESKDDETKEFVLSLTAVSHEIWRCTFLKLFT